ncbi:MAG: hypothetical protein ACR2PZ_27490 [Pseudomonadales bacterium]
MRGDKKIHGLYSGCAYLLDLSSVVPRPGTPLRADEIERYSQIIRDQEKDSQAQNTVRQFMGEDDGKEFLMVNLVEFDVPALNCPI